MQAQRCTASVGRGDTEHGILAQLEQLDLAIGGPVPMHQGAARNGDQLFRGGL
jgi:hypothetical protein